MKPILFNTEMVRGLLSGHKTVTRRVIKPQPLFHTGRKYIFADDVIPKKWVGCSNIIETYQYQPGDILYVRETWAIQENLWNGMDTIIYRADCRGSGENTRWHPSIHMPKEAARLFLRVTDVRVERLQDMIQEDAEKEGCSERQDPTTKFISSPLLVFYDLWNSTIKPKDIPLYGWDANPWVWVIEFERISREEVCI